MQCPHLNWQMAPISLRKGITWRTTPSRPVLGTSRWRTCGGRGVILATAVMLPSHAGTILEPAPHHETSETSLHLCKFAYPFRHRSVSLVVQQVGKGMHPLGVCLDDGQWWTLRKSDPIRLAPEAPDVVAANLQLEQAHDLRVFEQELIPCRGRTRTWHCAGIEICMMHETRPFPVTHQEGQDSDSVAREPQLPICPHSIHACSRLHLAVNQLRKQKLAQPS